jgi:ribonucleoside-diphosphate reductase alpha chain
MQAALQPLVDQAIAKTINIPEDASTVEFAEIYREAHHLGLKGVTTFRPSQDRPGVMTSCPTR